MNAKERLTATLAGETVDRPLNFDIMMVYASHHINQPLSRYYQDYRVLCEANYAVQRDFDLDILQAISDPYREAADFGSTVTFPHDGLPLLETPLLNDPANLKNLRVIDPGSGRRMHDRLEAIRKFKEDTEDIPIMGWVEGAIAEAADLRGVSNLLMDLIDNPEWTTELLEICTEQAIAFAEAQIDAGADIIGLGDAIASQISPRMMRRYALPYEKAIFAAVHAKGALARLHICGNTSRILDAMVETDADIIDIDWMVPMDAAVEAFGTTAVCGNFDPVSVMLQGTPDDVYQATKQCMAQGGRYFISGAGCEIPDNTPAENLYAQNRALNAR